MDIKKTTPGKVVIVPRPPVPADSKADSTTKSSSPVPEMELPEEKPSQVEEDKEAKDTDKACPCC